MRVDREAEPGRQQRLGHERKVDLVGAGSKGAYGHVEMVGRIGPLLFDPADDGAGWIGVDQHGVDLIVAAGRVDLEERGGHLAEFEAALAHFVTVGVEDPDEAGEVGLGVELVAVQTADDMAPGLVRLVVGTGRAHPGARCHPREVGRLGGM